MMTMDVGLVVCTVCSGHYPEQDGWGDLCASCCALLVEHREHAHEMSVVVDCRECG